MTADISAPPSQPLPPTPPNIRNAKQTAKQLLHRKSRSSDFSFSAAINEDLKEIDALTAGVLPLLVPGLKIGEEIRIRDWEEFSPHLSSTVTKKKSERGLKTTSGSEFGVLDWDGFAFPQCHSTPAQGKRNHRVAKISGHTRNQLSLPSRGLGKGGVHDWENDLNHELTTKVEEHATGDTNRRSKAWGNEAVPKTTAHPITERQVREHATTVSAALSRLTSTHNMHLRIEVPDATNTPRTSLATLIPPSAASTATLFDAEGIFEPTFESTPYDAQKGHAYTRKYQATGSRRSSIVYIKSDEKSSEPVKLAEYTASTRTRAPSVVKPLELMSSLLLPKSTTSKSKLTPQGGGLRPLSLLKDRDSNKEGDASKFAATRPLVLGKNRQKLKVTRGSDENTNPTLGTST